MNVVTLQNVGKDYGTRKLFQDVDLVLNDTDRLGLIGVNGTGKSTLLKVITGISAPDKGTIERNGKASIYYLPQQPEFDEEGTILENIFLSDHPIMAIVRRYEHLLQHDPKSKAFMDVLAQMDEKEGWLVEHEGKAILTKLGFGDLSRPVSELSGGQRRRLALGQALLYPCDLLLLDEPTNHLDEASIEWLENYLISRKGGLLLSTHDRYFLDAVCNGIVELSNRRIYRYEGKYEDYLKLKAEREEREAATEEKRRQFLKREIEWVRRGAQARSTKQKARLQRFENLSKMEMTRKVDSMDPIALESRLGKTIFDIENLSFSYDEKRPIISNFTYHVVKHDRIGIVGPNGVGKSTFMKLLNDELEPTAGTTGKGETVRIAYFKQELPPMDEDMRVLDYIKEEHNYMSLNDGSTLSAGQALERFLFTPEMHGVLIRKLSGGERRRLYLLRLLMSAPNVLLLDEPTNDLDIPTLEVLEDFLDTFGGVVITVSHDRYFLDRVCDKLFVYTPNGNISIYHGSYSDSLEDVSGLDRRGNIIDATLSAEKKEPVKEKVVVAKEEQKKALTLGEEKEYEEIMNEIPRLELLLKGIDASLSRIGSDYDDMKDLLAQREETQSQIETLEMRWMELEEKKNQ